MCRKPHPTAWLEMRDDMPAQIATPNVVLRQWTLALLRYARKMYRSSGMLRGIRSLSQYAKNKQVYLFPESNHLIASFTKSASGVNLGTVTGYTGSSSSTIIDINPNNFVANTKFLDVLHKTIGDTVENDFLFVMEAGVNANQYMPIYDFRKTPNYARIPEVDDIFGYVHVDGNGKIIPGTYEPNLLYRLCNGESGIIQLSDYLYEQVQRACGGIE